jgi:hypothetical protein
MNFNETMSINTNTKINLIIGDYSRTQEALRGLSGAENYTRQPSELEVHGEEEEEEMIFQNTPVGNLDFLGGGEIIADSQGNITTRNEFFTYDPTSRSYRIERLNKKITNQLAEEERHWGSTPNVSYPFKRTPIIGERIKVNKNKNEIKKLKILHWNANSVIGKNAKLETLIAQEKPDIISLNETRTNGTTDSYIFKLCGQKGLGYIPFIRNRPEKEKKITQVSGLNGGGVALLVRDGLTFDPDFKVPEKFSKLEAVTAKIKFGDKYIAFFSWYVPPDIKKVDREFLEFIEGQGEFVLMGDLNARLKRFGGTNECGRELDESLLSFKGIVLNPPNKPTFYRHTEGILRSTSTLDLIICDEKSAKSLTSFDSLKLSPVYDKDEQYFHLPVICEFNIEVKRRKERLSFHRSFLYAKANWRKFMSDMDVEVIDDVEELTLDGGSDRIVKAFLVAANNNIPKSKENKGRENNFPPEIVSVLKSRNYWGRLYRKNRDEFTERTYKLKIELANELIAKYKQEQWNDFLNRQGKSPLSTIPFWKRINRLRESKRKNSSGALLVDGKVVDSSEEKANVFADSLEKKFSNDENSHFKEGKKIEIEEFLMKENFESLYSTSQKRVMEFSMEELTRAIKEMNSKTSTDPFGMSNKMIKHSSCLMKERLLEIFNRCLNEKKVPQNWKHSVISMLLKSGQDGKIVSSFRPISMTPCIARLFERLILSRLHKHMKSNNILVKNQSGFRKNRQTKDNLLFLTQKAQEGFNEDKKTLAVFFDVAAAFDKVWHLGVIYKLIQLKVPYYLIVIIWAFLSDRTFVVKVDGVKSSIRIIICGVPQGGVLSPTLFSLYINDLPLAEGEEEKTLLFADDIVYLLQYRFRKNKKVIPEAKGIAEKTAQDYLSRLEEWMSTWRLSLAPHKCAQITLTKAKDSHKDKMTLRLYGDEIPEDLNPKFLGIVFDRRLNFSNHLNSLDAKIRDRMNLLKILAYDKNWRLNRHLLVKIYKVLIRSVLDYACVSLAGLTSDLRKSFEIIQNNALRIILNIKLSDEVSIENLREMANVSSIEARHSMLLDRYYENALLSNNPLIKDLFDGYKKFKRRNFISEDLSINKDGIISIETLELIRAHNIRSINSNEMYPTTLCRANKTIRDLLTDNYIVDGAIT